MDHLWALDEPPRFNSASFAPGRCVAISIQGKISKLNLLQQT
jgi:hypothetical protein